MRPARKKSKSKKKVKRIIEMVNLFSTTGGAGSLSRYRGDRQGFEAGNRAQRLKRTHRKERVEKLVQEKTRLLQESNPNGFGEMIPYDREISNLESSVRELKNKNSDNLPTQILINMVQQQNQQQNLISRLEKNQEEDNLSNIQDLGSLQSLIENKSIPRENKTPPATTPNPEPIQDNNPSDDEQEPANLPPPSAIARRRGRGEGQVLSPMFLNNMTESTKLSLGLEPSANHSTIRSHINSLGVELRLPSGRKHSPSYIIQQAIIKQRENVERRTDDIQAIPPPREEPIGTGTPPSYSDNEEE